MPQYVEPTYNLSANVWRGNLDPTADPPTLTTDANLAWGKRGGPAATGGTGSLGVIATAPQLLVPAGTDLRSAEKGAPNDDWVEVPAGTGRIYACVYVEDIGKGFSNEHRGALLVSAPDDFPWPFPIP